MTRTFYLIYIIYLSFLDCRMFPIALYRYFRNQNRTYLLNQSHSVILGYPGLQHASPALNFKLIYFAVDMHGLILYEYKITLIFCYFNVHVAECVDKFCGRVNGIMFVFCVYCVRFVSSALFMCVMYVCVTCVCYVHVCTCVQYVFVLYVVRVCVCSLFCVCIMCVHMCIHMF